MSRRTRSGTRALARSSASGPDEAHTTSNPCAPSTASSRRVFCGASSTARIVGTSATAAQVPSHLAREFADADRLSQVAVEPAVEEPLAVAHHRRGRERDDGDLRRSVVLLQLAEGLGPVHVRHPDVHQHQVGQVLHGGRDAVDATVRLEGAEAGEAEDVPRELPVLRVVVDDQDQLVGHLYDSCSSGSVNRNVLPASISLSTHSRPPCSSTNFRESGSPSPVPSSRVVWPCSNSSKISSRSAGAMPAPVSATAISTAPSTERAETSTRPSGGVNLIAFESRLNTTCRTRRSSASTVTSSPSTSRLSAIPPRLARSPCIVTPLRRMSAIETSEKRSSRRPASILARSSTSLMSASRCRPASSTSST